jgi:hypothetical protein
MKLVKTGLGVVISAHMVPAPGSSLQFPLERAPTVAEIDAKITAAGKNTVAVAALNKVKKALTLKTNLPKLTAHSKALVKATAIANTATTKKTI